MCQTDDTVRWLKLFIYFRGARPAALLMNFQYAKRLHDYTDQMAIDWCRPPPVIKFEHTPAPISLIIIFELNFEIKTIKAAYQLIYPLAKRTTIHARGTTTTTTTE